MKILGSTMGKKTPNMGTKWVNMGKMFRKMKENQNFAQRQQNFAPSHNGETVTFRNSDFGQLPGDYNVAHNNHLGPPLTFLACSNTMFMN